MRNRVRVWKADVTVVTASQFGFKLMNAAEPSDFGGSRFFALTHAGGKNERKLPRRAAFLDFNDFILRPPPPFR
jgi:hypothetical protein